MNIFTSLGDDKKALSCNGISDQGIVPNYLFYYEHDNGPVSRSVLHQEPVVINDTGLESRFSSASFDKDIKSELVLPMISGDIFQGTLDLSSNLVNAFSPDAVRVFQSLANNIAVAIRNAKLYHSEQLRRQIIERVQDVIGRISADITLDEVLDKLLIELEKTLPCDASAVWLFEDVTSDIGMEQFTSSLKLAAVRVNDQSVNDDNQTRSLNTNDIKDLMLQNEEDTKNLLLIHPWLSEIVNSNQPVIRGSTSPYDPLGGILSLPSEYSALGIPLQNNGQSLGIIILVDHLPDQYTSESQLIASIYSDLKIDHKETGTDNCCNET